MMEQGIDQGSVEIAGRRVDDEARGLVYDQQMIVLEDNLQRNILRFIMRRLGLRDGDPKAFVAFDLYRRIAKRRAFRFHGAAADQVLQPLARHGRDGIGERAIQPPAGMGRLQAHLDRLNSPHPGLKYGFRSEPLQWRRPNLARG